MIIHYAVEGDTGYSLLGVVKDILIISCGLGGVSWAGAFWFLRALFLVSLIFLCIRMIIHKVFRDNRITDLLTFFPVTLILLLGYKKQFPYNISSSFVALFFYFAGYLLAKNRDIIKMNFWIAFASFIIVVCCSFFNSPDLAYNKYNSLFLFVLSGLCGTYMIMYISFKIKGNHFLELIGQNSITIMIFHFFSFVFINLIIVLWYALPVQNVLAYPCIKNYPYWWILYSFAGVFIPLVFNKIIIGAKRKLPQFLFLPYWFEKINIQL